jgi:hypothetical protein
MAMVPRPLRPIHPIFFPLLTFVDEYSCANFSFLTSWRWTTEISFFVIPQKSLLLFQASTLPTWLHSSGQIFRIYSILGIVLALSSSPNTWFLPPWSPVALSKCIQISIIACLTFALIKTVRRRNSPFNPLWIIFQESRYNWLIWDELTIQYLAEFWSKKT